MNWTIIAAVNNEAVLNHSLLSSPDLKAIPDVILQRGFANAAEAYNSAIQKASSDLLIFVHQDVYLPAGWVASVEATLSSLAQQDPTWGVLGVWGVKSSGATNGFLYCNATGRVLGDRSTAFAEVQSLDEVLLIMRKSSGLTFDQAIKGYHLYGTDLCLEAAHRGLKCYSIPAFCVHNTNSYHFLPWQFWKTYLYLRKKWREQLPINTSCTIITPWCCPMIRWIAVRTIQTLLRDVPLHKRVDDPGALYRQISERPL